MGAGDDTALQAIIDSGALRTNVVQPGSDKLVVRLRAQAADGDGDSLLDIHRVLELPSAMDSAGNVVWPAVAVKDPTLWDSSDEAMLSALGFSPDDIAASRLKGRYLDKRIVISAAGEWTSYRIGE